MADVILSRSSGGEPLFARLLHAVHALLGGVQDGLAAHRRYQVLSSMSDRALSDIGLARADIAREAMFPSKELAL